MLNRFIKWLTKDFNLLFLLFILLFILNFGFINYCYDRFDKLENYHNRKICPECGQALDLTL